MSTQLRWSRLLKIAEIPRFERVAPELQDGERHEPNRRDLDARRNGVIVISVRWFVEVGVGYIGPRVSIVAVVEVVALGVMVAVIAFVSPRDVDRVVLCKPDGTVFVPTDDHRKPQNWQPPGVAVEITTRNPLTIEAVRSNPEEVIQIRCSTVFFAALMRLDDTATLDLQGTEDDLRAHIFANPEVIEDGFRPETKEYDTPAGPVDVWGYDADGPPVILELKRRRAGPAAVSQLRRYVEGLDSDARGILVAASLTARAEALLDEFGLERRTITPPTLNSSTNRSLDEFATMGEHD